MKRLKLFIILILLCAFFGKSPSSSATSQNGLGSSLVYLPIIYTPPGPAIPTVNVPFISGDIQAAVTNQTAIFWFGRVYETENYTDVRVAYTEEFLYVRLAVFDRQLWYDKTPSIQDLTDWDSAALYLDLDGNVGNSVDLNSYAFLGQLAWNEPNMEAAYQGNNGQWQQVSIPFGSYAGWKSDGSGINDDSKPDRGWTLTYNIPYSSLGLSGMPAQGKVWGLAIVLYDRDDQNGAIQIPEKTWPPAMTPSTPSSWAKLSFGLPSFTALPTQPDGKTTIRHGDSNGNVVKDGMVGGGSVCGSGLYSFGEWGEKNYAGAHQINIQNQHDIADWPCFSKFYLTFPLDKVPAGVQITSATLTMMHFSNAGNVGGTTNPVVSLLQVLTVAEDWNESTLTWNNAPLALENISRTWVESIYNIPPVPRVWDVSLAVAEALDEGKPLRLAVYSADADYHSGKYFHSSDAAYDFRPMLTVNWANP
jgi:hypothetical protein